MNVEKRIQRLERQNERLKLALIGMGLVGWFADRSPKAPKWVEAPMASIPTVTLGRVKGEPPPLPGTSVQIGPEKRDSGA